jgi:two-component system cell cycle sensor histidine kinase/response regulator CckA
MAAQCRDGIELLVTDVVMPGMNGQELAELLLATHSQMKVLYVSGQPYDVIMHFALPKPGAAFLQKPFTRDTLRKKVKEVLRASEGNTDTHLGAAQ